MLRTKRSHIYTQMQIVFKNNFLALHGLSEKLPEKKRLRNRLSAYFSGEDCIKYVFFNYHIRKTDYAIK